MKSNASNWFNIEPRQNKWLVDGLIPSDGYTALIGKPKAGKSTFLRSLIASIVKNKTFLGRSVEVPAGQGVVLYIHIDRKDSIEQVAEELRDVLKITEQEAQRIHIRTANAIPQGSSNRLEWLKKEALSITPHLIVIDILWAFTNAKNANDYKEVLDSINSMQDALESIDYNGSLLVTLHGRKATNPNDEADDVIGSTAQRGSFGTGIYLARDRNAGHYTIFSDQTIRDEVYGEIDKSVLLRRPDGSLELGALIRDLAKAEKLKKSEEDLQRLLDFIARHPMCKMDEIMGNLTMSRRFALALMKRAGDMVRSKGKGVSGDPLLYYVYGMEEGIGIDAQAAGIVQAEADALVEMLEKAQ